MIQSILNKTQNKGQTVESLKVNGITSYDLQAITSEFCKHFSTVGERYAKKIAPSRKNINNYLAEIPQNCQSMFFEPKNSREIIEVK